MNSSGGVRESWAGGFEGGRSVTIFTRTAATAALPHDGFGEQHCRIHCEQDEDQEKALCRAESEAVPCQRPSAQRGDVGSQPLGESPLLLAPRRRRSQSSCPLRPSDVPPHLQLRCHPLGTLWQMGDGSCPAVRYRGVRGDLWRLCRSASSHRTCVAFSQLFPLIFPCPGHRQGGREGGRPRKRERGVSALNSSSASCCAHVG